LEGGCPALPLNGGGEAVLKLSNAELEQQNACFSVFVECVKFGGSGGGQGEIVKAGLFHDGFIEQGILRRQFEELIRQGREI
jgi:hypothetical protein